MIDKFAKVLVDDFLKDIESHKEKLASAGCRTFDEYKYTCGLIQGLGRAVQAITDLAKKAEEADD